MKAITLYPEWLWAIENLGKDVENRSWKPTKDVYPTEENPYPLALHAGMKIGGVDGKRVRLAALQVFVDAVNRTGQSHGVLVGIEDGWPGVIFSGVRGGGLYLNTSSLTHGAITAVTHVWRVSKNSDSPWAAEGQVHWCLGRVLILPTPIPIKGKQRLWTVPEEVGLNIKEQIMRIQ